jgi:hypothetical protein
MVHSLISTWLNRLKERLRKVNRREVFYSICGLAVQLLIFYGIQELYKFGRGKAIAGKDIAFEHAYKVVRLEQSIGLYWETSIQHFVLTHARWLATVMNQYYISGYFPPVLVFFVWMFIFRRQYFPFVRDAFYLGNVAAMTIFFLFPCAPPRLLPPSYGFVDTLKEISGIDFYTNVKRLYPPNPYAAIPSMHVGYTFIVGFVLWRVLNKKFSFAFLLYPLTMWFTTIATGNHYIVDGVFGIMCICFGFTVVELYACLRKFDSSKYTPWPGYQRKFGKSRQYEPLSTVEVESVPTVTEPLEQMEDGGGDMVVEMDDLVASPNMQQGLHHLRPPSADTSVGLPRSVVEV